MVAGIIVILMGILFITLGLLLWKRQKISLLHDYHSDKVSEDDLVPFCKQSGIGIIIAGSGMIASGILIIIFEKPIVFLVMAVTFVIGISMLVQAGNKYNH